MRRRGSVRFQRRAVIRLMLVLPFACGCLVEKGKYDQVLEDVATCRERVEGLRSENQSLRREAAAVQEQNLSLEKQNRVLLEEMAGLHAEYEELARRTALYRERADELDRKREPERDAYRRLLASLSTEIDQGNIRIDLAGTRLKLNLLDKILFPSGSATLTEQGRRILDRVGYALRETRDRRIIIEGHTDDRPLGPELRKIFESNWDLSARRATTVVHYLEQTVGIDPRLLSATAYSKYAPIAENDTAENRSLNRRIEIVLIPLTPQEMQRLYVLSPEASPRTPRAIPDAASPPPAIIPVLP